MKTLIIFLILLLPAGSTFAGGKIFGAGNISCETYLEAYKDQTSEQTVFLSILSWCTGYLTAFSAFSQNDLGHPTDSDIAIWVKDYCTGHPADNMFKATEKLIEVTAAKIEAKNKATKD